MPLGTPVLGTAVVVLVGATSTPATPLGGLNSWSYGDDVPTNARPYYGQPTAYAVGKHARTITLNCDYETADSGQIVLFAAKVSSAVIWVMFKVDGTNGETLPCRVSSAPIAGGDVGQFSTVSFTLVQSTDPAVVGGGFGT